MAVIAVAGLGALWLVGCSDSRRVVIYNETGTLVGVHWSEKALAMFDHKEPYAFTLRSGRHKHLRAFGEDLDEVISAGGCEYRYRVPAIGYGSQRILQVSIQIEPDFSVHLLSLGHGRVQRGVFMDDAIEGFPIIPVKTCPGAGAVQAGPNTSAPSQAAAAAKL